MAEMADATGGGGTPDGLAPDFSSISAADRAYFGDGQEDRDGDGQPDPTGWGEPQPVPTNWRGGWTLVRQARIEDPSETRYLVIRVTPDGSEQALNEGGQPEDVSLSAPLEGVPTFGTEQDAREAYNAWLSSADADGDGQPDEGGNAEWGEWSKVTEAPPWWIWGREHKSAERMQMLAAGTLGDGSAVYLQADGSVADQAHIFSNPDDLKAALNAYASKVENGEIPANQRPTGNSPNSDTVSQAGNRAGAGGPPMMGGGSGGGIVSMLTSPMGMVAVLVVVAVLVYAYREGHLADLGLAPNGGTQA